MYDTCHPCQYYVAFTGLGTGTVLDLCNCKSFVLQSAYYKMCFMTMTTGTVWCVAHFPFSCCLLDFKQADIRH
jgi:hypothetical protein